MSKCHKCQYQNVNINAQIKNKIQYHVRISKLMSNVKNSKGPISTVQIKKQNNVKCQNLVYHGPFNA